MRQVRQKCSDRERRRRRIRAKISGTAGRPRLSVFRSSRYMYAELIDDSSGSTIAAASSKNFQGKSALEKARLVGKFIAELAGKKGIKKVVFDRGGYVYAGKVKALADGAREGGLNF